MKRAKNNWQKDNSARFVCCLTLFWPDGKSYMSKGIVNGKISLTLCVYVPHDYTSTYILNSSRRTTLSSVRKHNFNCNAYFKRVN